MGVTLRKLKISFLNFFNKKRHRDHQHVNGVTLALRFFFFEDLFYTNREALKMPWISSAALKASKQTRLPPALFLFPPTVGTLPFPSIDNVIFYGQCAAG
jgi:hypothetical protein